MKKKKVAIVIPTHKKDFSDDELLSLKHLNHFLPNSDKCFVLPKKIDKPNFNDFSYQVVHFPNRYFTSVPSYCEMINLKEFYQSFNKYDYMLLHQLDVLIFSSNIDKFIRFGYDYVGPPFFRPIIGYLTYKKGSPLSGGNGGFSLRKIASSIEVIKEAEKEAVRKSNDPAVRKKWFLKAVLTGKSHGKWLKAPPYCYPFNEDGFWSYEAIKYVSSFRVAPFNIALQFGIEKFPQKCFKLNNYKLPFGAHAWEKYDREFWTYHLMQN